MLVDRGDPLSESGDHMLVRIENYRAENDCLTGHARDRVRRDWVQPRNNPASHARQDITNPFSHGRRGSDDYVRTTGRQAYYRRPEPGLRAKRRVQIGPLLVVQEVQRIA